jgi:predicted acyl esterase
MHRREPEDVIGCRAPFPLRAARPDLLVFQTPPLTEELTIVGGVVVSIFISSDATDTDVTVKLIDVYTRSESWPDGFHLNLADTVKGSARDWFTEVQRSRPTAPVDISLKQSMN